MSIDEVTWQDLWNVCFPPALKPNEVAAMDYVLKRVPGVVGDELKEAVISLADSGRYDPFKSKPGQLKAEVMRNRPNAVEDPQRPEYEAACKKMAACASPAGRWDILCDSIPNGPAGIELAERLERYGKTLPGGIASGDGKKMEQLKSVIHSIGHPEDRRDQPINTWHSKHPDLKMITAF